MLTKTLNILFLMGFTVPATFSCNQSDDGEEQIDEQIEYDTSTAEKPDEENTDDEERSEVDSDLSGAPDDYDFGDEYTEHDPIIIDGNDQFHAMAEKEGWPGDGSPESPYIIEALEIDLKGGEGGAIDVSNTDVHFVVRSCYLHGGIHKLGSAYGYGVLTENVSNMRVERTVATDNFEGIRLDKDTRDCVIHYNDLSKNAGHGIALASAHGNVIEYNLCALENDDGMLFGSFDAARNFDASNDNIIRYNEFRANSTSHVCLFRGHGNQFYGNAFGKGCTTPVLNTAGQNTWDSEETKTGNWWINFKGGDADGDGIIDVKRTISGGGVDRYPLARKPDTTP